MLIGVLIQTANLMETSAMKGLVKTYKSCIFLWKSSSYEAGAHCVWYTDLQVLWSTPSTGNIPLITMTSLTASYTLFLSASSGPQHCEFEAHLNPVMLVFIG